MLLNTNLQRWINMTWILIAVRRYPTHTSLLVANHYSHVARKKKKKNHYFNVIF
jgi:hypothetical protein